VLNKDVSKQEHRLFRQLSARALDLSRAALVCIDAQNVQHPEYGLGAWCRQLGLHRTYRYYANGIREALGVIREVQGTCREVGVPVIHIRTASLTADSHDTFSLGHVTEFRQVHGEDDFLSQIIADVEPQPGEPIVTKLAAGAFNSSPLDQMLREMRIEDVICCGFVTNGCVETTVRGAVDRGYRVFLVSDGVSAWSKGGHERALDVMGRFFAVLMEGRDLCSLLRKIHAQAVGRRGGTTVVQS